MMAAAMSTRLNSLICSLVLAALVPLVPDPARALSETTVAEALLVETGISEEVRAVYAERGFHPIWVGADNGARLDALLEALASASEHGLPAGRYRLRDLAALSAAHRHGPEAAATELMATRIFLRYAQDLLSGALEPSAVDSEIDVRPPRRSEAGLLKAVTMVPPHAFFAALAPRTEEYRRLLEEKRRLEIEVATDDTPALGNRTLRLGARGPEVTALRHRLEKLGFGPLGEDERFDRELRDAVRAFQRSAGLAADGIVGPGTLRALGGNAREKLRKVIVALERERWLNRERGERHIVVNIADQSFDLYEHGNPVFHSIAVVGRATPDRRTPEFHDEMTHMVVNPTWHVPRSIATKEYLPQLKRDPNALARQGLRLIGPSGRAVNASAIDFSQFSKQNFPFAIKQPPGGRNALGRVKFMFPNKHNIYLHDTPAKKLFQRDVRAFSHGCIRVERPFEFAHKLLEKQTSDPRAAFEAYLRTGREQYVNLAVPVPVYLTYRTAFLRDGRIEYRPDIYGRDARLWQALVEAGLESPAIDG